MGLFATLALRCDLEFWFFLIFFFFFRRGEDKVFLWFSLTGCEG